MFARIDPFEDDSSPSPSDELDSDIDQMSGLLVSEPYCSTREHLQLQSLVKATPCPGILSLLDFGLIPHRVREQIVHVVRDTSFSLSQNFSFD